MRKFLLFLAVLMLLPGVQAFASFSDVDSSSVYFDSVYTLEESGVVEGYVDGTFKPDQKVNRAEFLKMLFEMIGFDEKTVDAVLVPFADVPADEWYTKYVKKAYLDKIVDGYPDGTFRPANKINLVEAIKIVMNAYFDVDTLYAMNDSPGPCWGEESSVSDDALVDVNAWYFKYLKVADDYCILQGAYGAFGMGGVFPDAEISRGDMASLLFRANWVLENDMKPFEVLPDEGGQVVSELISNLLIEDFAFSPSELTVKVGTTLTWTNMDSMAHTVTSEGNFDSGSIAKGEEFSYTFNDVGLFEYICSFHPSMVGAVTVVE